MHPSSLVYELCRKRERELPICQEIHGKYIYLFTFACFRHKPSYLLILLFGIFWIIHSSYYYTASLYYSTDLRPGSFTFLHFPNLIFRRTIFSSLMNTLCYHNKNRSYHCCRPYFAEYPGSHLNSEGKQRKARLVLDLGTVRESLRVLTAFYILKI